MDQDIADQVYADFAKYFNAGDIEGLLDLYEPDAVFVRGPGDNAIGREQIHKGLQAFLDVGGQISFRTRHAVRNGDIALLSNEYTLEAKDDNGKPYTLTGKTSEIVRRQSDGRWLYMIDHPAGAED